MKKILILGRNGYISKSFQNYIKQFDDYEVCSISVRDEKWKEYSFSCYDVIFNTIGLAHNNTKKAKEKDYLFLNTQLPFELALKAKMEKVPLFIHMSSMIIYGKQEIITEKTEPKPDNIYGMSKFLGEEKIKSLSDNAFKIAFIRSPLVYSENAVANFKKLLSCALRMPIFPHIKNRRSMIYADNLCELVRLIIDNQDHLKKLQYYYPQQEKYICTSQIVYDLAQLANHHMVFTKIFNSILRPFIPKIKILNKIFGDKIYKMDISDVFEGKYRVVLYEKSLKKIIDAQIKR